MAQSCLSTLNRVNNKFLMGTNVQDALGESNPSVRSNASSLTSKKQICYLARTNLALFQKAVQVVGCDSSSPQKQKPKISFVGVSQICIVT